MESGVKAVFYDFKYYILPSDTDIDALSGGSVITAKRLKEVGCMAPDFIYESIEEEILHISDRALLFPVTVNLYSSEEYDEILSKHVDKLCVGCARYIDDGKKELDGHHREMSLNGVCYEREDEGDDTVAYAKRVFLFYSYLAEHSEELKKLVDGGNGVKLNKICKKCAEVMMAPEKFYGEKKDGRYVLFWRAYFGSSVYQAMLAYTALCSHVEDNPFTKDGWSIIPFIPEGAEGYKGKIDGSLLVGRLAPSEGEARKFSLKVGSLKKLSEKEKRKFTDDIYEYLCFTVGEDKILRVLDGIEFDGGEAPTATADEICEKLRKADAELPPSYPPAYAYGWQDGGAAPHKNSAEGISACAAFANLSYDISLVDEVGFDGEFAYAYIYIPVSQENSELPFEAVDYYIGNERRVPEPIRDKEYFVVSALKTGVCECSSGGECGFAFDFFVADEKGFYRFIKILAPVLSGCGAKLVVFNKYGVNEYLCGTEILSGYGGEDN